MIFNVIIVGCRMYRSRSRDHVRQSK